MIHGDLFPPLSPKGVDALSLGIFQRDQRLTLSTSGFVVREAVSSAGRMLGEKTRFELPPEQWQEFAARLDQEPRELPVIGRLLREPSLFDE